MLRQSLSWVNRSSLRPFDRSTGSRLRANGEPKGLCWANRLPFDTLRANGFSECPERSRRKRSGRTVSRRAHASASSAEQNINRLDRSPWAVSREPVERSNGRRVMLTFYETIIIPSFHYSIIPVFFFLTIPSSQDPNFSSFIFNNPIFFNFI